MRKWSKGDIRFTLQLMDMKSIDLSEDYIRKCDPDLYKAACSKRRFGSWRAALIASGIDYENDLLFRVPPENRLSTP